MSYCSLSNILDSQAGLMDSCYKLYTWINQAMLMLFLQFFWRMNQLSDYFREKSVEEAKEDNSLVFTPLTKESKFRRHIRSMSDVQSSTPYRLPFRARIGSTHTLMYDSDTRAKRIRSYQPHRRHVESSDSSDYEPRKIRSLEKHILKHTDSMRVL